MWSSQLTQKKHLTKSKASQVAQVVKNPPANAGDARDVGLVPELGRSPRGGNGNPLQYSCLENSMDRGVWWATVHGVPKSWTWLNNWACPHAVYWSFCFHCCQKQLDIRSTSAMLSLHLERSSCISVRLGVAPFFCRTGIPDFNFGKVSFV